MADSLRVNLNQRLLRHVSERSGPDGLYDSADEYLRDLVRRDYEREQALRWASLKRELQDGLDAPNEEFTEFDVATINALGRSARTGQHEH